MKHYRIFATLWTLVLAVTFMKEVQAEGKKRMSGGDYLRGHAAILGKRFG